jgi:hypothetical protein
VDDLFTDDKYKVLYRHRLACEKAQDTPSSGALERLQTWFREHGCVCSVCVVSYIDTWCVC